MQNELKQMYYNNLLNADNIIEILDDCRNDEIIERDFDVECIMENLINLINDNVEQMANNIIDIYEKYGGISEN